MENRLEELASILDWVDDFALEPKWRLTPWHATFVDGEKEISGARNLDTLRARLSGCMLRRTRSEVLTQLPPRTDVRVPVEMTQAQFDEHAALDQPIAQLRRRAKKRPLTQAEFLKLMQLLTVQRIVSNGLAQLQFTEFWPQIQRQRPTETVLRSLCSPKILELRELIRRLAVDQARKIVVFSQWRRMLVLASWAISDILDEARLRAVFFTGHEGQKRRTQNVVEFHDDPGTRVFFASDAGGVGLNLQRAANCCINFELPWNPAVLEQRIGRIYRIGQTRPIDVFNLVSDVGIESRIAGLVGSKQALFRGLFDGDSDTVEFENSGSFLARLEKIEELPAIPDFAEVDGAAEISTEPSAEERELDEVIALADESGDSADAEERAASPQPSVEEFFSQLEIKKRADGGIRIDAPREAAAVLGDLFAGMAKLLRASAGE